MAFGFKSATDTSDIHVTDENGRSTATERDSEDRNAGVLGALNSSSRQNSNPDDLAMNSSDDGTMDMGTGNQHDGSLAKQFSSAYSQVGDNMFNGMSLPDDQKQMLKQQLMGAFGNVQWLETALSVIDALRQSGTHGVGGEMGNPQANLAPPTVGIDQPDRGVQVTQ